MKQQHFLPIYLLLLVMPISSGTADHLGSSVWSLRCRVLGVGKILMCGACRTLALREI